MTTYTTQEIYDLARGFAQGTLTGLPSAELSAAFASEVVRLHDALAKAETRVNSFRAWYDDLDIRINYYDVCRKIEKILGLRPRKMRR